MISAFHFHDLLDCLAGQFFDNESARCSEDEYGINVSLNSKEYFSIAVIAENLPDDLVVLGVLFDDSAYIKSRNGYTFTIYIDTTKIKGESFKVFSSVILAHEICHFAFYYELFIRLGDNTGMATHNNFSHTVSSTLIGAITEEADNTSQTIFDEHNIMDLKKNMGEYPKRHFSKGKETKLNYSKFFDNFLNHLHFQDTIKNNKGKT